MAEYLNGCVPRYPQQIPSADGKRQSATKICLREKAGATDRDHCTGCRECHGPLTYGVHWLSVSNAREMDRILPSFPHSVRFIGLQASGDITLISELLSNLLLQ